MNKLVWYLIGAIVVVVAVFVIKERNVAPIDVVTTQEVYPAQAVPSQVPVAELPLNTKSEVKNALESEAGQIDKELQNSDISELDPSGLSNSQLGL